MSTFKAHEPISYRRRRTHRRNRRLAVVLGGITLAAISIGVVGGLAVNDRQSGSDATPTDHSHADGGLPAGYHLTGQVGPMGGKIIETPGTRSGTVAAGGVSVTDGADITMGHIPLAYAVVPTWHLRNTTDRAVTLGTPKVTVVKGCCPADPVLGSTTLAPGAETTLQFPTQMHPGMDGDHLFRLTVPVNGSNDPLTVSVAGDFS